MFRVSPDSIHKSPLSPFFKGGGYKDRKQRENSRLRHSKKLRFAAPLFEKEGPGEIYTAVTSPATRRFLPVPFAETYPKAAIALSDSPG